MLDSIETRDLLDQVDEVREIKDGFGEMFIYRNDGGNEAIDRAVLSEFRKLCSHKAVWGPSGTGSP